MTDATELVSRCLAGDDDAPTEVVRLHGEAIYRFIASMIRDEAQAKDLTQETFARAFERMAELADRSKLLPWIYRIALNKVRNAVRAARRRPRPESPSRLEARGIPQRGGRSVLSSVIRHEAADRIARAIDDLPERQREVFLLHYIEHLAYEEIAGILGAGVPALHLRAHRAKAALREALGSLVDTVWREGAGP